MKYDKMVAIIQEESRQKIQLAQETIVCMVEKRERVTVAELVKRTGLSRGFFYKNQTIRAEMDAAVCKQKELFKVADSGQKIKDEKMEDELLKEKKQNQRLLEQNQELKDMNEQLRQEIAKLKKRLCRKELSILKSL